MSTIERSDLKFFPSERLNDTDEGGGLALGTAIKGEANALFDPISAIARVNGNFAARLFYAGVQRADNAPLLGAFVAITKPPKDKSTEYLLTRAKFGERRQSALKRIEAYSAATIESRLTLLSVQSSGAKLIQAYQRESEPLPYVGEVYCLRQDKQGYAYAEQYIKVMKVTGEVREFYNPTTKNYFKRMVVKIETSQALDFDFVGQEYPTEEYADAPCKIRETQVVDAGKYYGIKRLVQAIAAHTQKLQVQSIFAKIIPTSQIELPIVDENAVGQQSIAAATGAQASFSHFTRYHYGQAPTKINLPTAVAQGSVNIQTDAAAISDKNGTLIQGDKSVGFIDYMNGIITLTSDTRILIQGDIRYSPAGQVSMPTSSFLLPIDDTNQSQSFVLDLGQNVVRGSISVVYIAQGTRIVLKDNGANIVGANIAHGTGSFSAATGSLLLSLGALPDVGTGIMVSYVSTPAIQSTHTPSAKLIIPLSKKPRVGSIRLQWTDIWGSYTASVADDGTITGGWHGVYNSTQNRLEIDAHRTINLQKDLQVQVNYNFGNKVTERVQVVRSDNNVVINLTGKAIMPNTLSMRAYRNAPKLDNLASAVLHTGEYLQMLKDDGAGKIVDENGNQRGTIDYSAKRIVLPAFDTINVPVVQYKHLTLWDKIKKFFGQEDTITDYGSKGVLMASHTIVNQSVQATIAPNATFTLDYFDDDEQQSTSENIAVNTIEVDLVNDRFTHLAPSSVWFNLHNISVRDVNMGDKGGMLYNVQNNEKIGTIDYQTGIASVQTAAFGSIYSVKLNPTIHSALKLSDITPVAQVAFMTKTAPVCPQSLTIHATTVDGKNIKAQADKNGKLQADDIVGAIDTKNGMVFIRFGKWIPLSQAQNLDNFDEKMLVDGRVWQPTMVVPTSIRYSAVGYSYLPIDSQIIKIDTVRLPLDGRVPIFRKGDTILIANSQSQTLGSAFSAGQVIALERQKLSRICVKDSDGVAVNANLWQHDLSAGTIQFATPLNLASYKMPLIATHTIEETNRVMEVDIDGTLSLLFPTKNHYPIEDTYVSSVLVAGDLKVGVSVPFTQTNWDNVWRDEAHGASLLNKLNIKDYPFLLTDDGAISERWMLKFSSPTQFDLYGETLGFVLRADTLTDLAPINPATKKPYFTLPKQAFGNQAPWRAQDVIRFNTQGTLMPVWALLSVQPSADDFGEEDGFTMCLYGDT